jgi:hypothetical protein
MRKPWLWAATAVLWIAVFDVQVRRAADDATSNQVLAWRTGQPVALLADVMEPRIRAAAYLASGVTATLVILVLAWGQRPGAAVARAT